MDSHTLSSASQYTSQQKLHVQQLSKNGLLSVAYVRRRFTAHPVCFPVLIARGAYCRSSDARDHPWRYYWYGICRCMDVSRLSNTSGYLSSRIMRFAQERNFVDHDSYVVLYVSLALFTVGAASSLGNDDLLAAFAAGLFIVHDDAVSVLILV
jgi:hypothetical protein